MYPYALVVLMVICIRLISCLPLLSDRLSSKYEKMLVKLMKE